MAKVEFSTTYQETIDLVVDIESMVVKHALICYLMRKVDPHVEFSEGVIYDYYQIYQVEFERITVDIEDAPKPLVPIIEYIRDDDLFDMISSIYIE